MGCSCMCFTLIGMVHLLLNHIQIGLCKKCPIRRYYVLGVWVSVSHLCDALSTGSVNLASSCFTFPDRVFHVQRSREK